MTRDRAASEQFGASDWADLYRRQDTAARYDRRWRGLRGRLDHAWLERSVLAALKRLGSGRLPPLVVDAPAGTGRFTAALRRCGVRVLHLDRSPAMLQTLRRRHGAGLEVIGDLRRPPLAGADGACVLCLRLLQHLGPAERVEALRGLRRMAPRALVAYYPGWHQKDAARRLRHRLGLPHGTLRPRLSPADIRSEAAEAGWRVAGLRRVLPWFSETVLVLLEDPESRPRP